jgi:hypothetical protein
MFSFLVRMLLDTPSVIHFCHRRQLSRNDHLIHINEAFGPGTISLFTVRRWSVAFASGKSSLTIMIDPQDRSRQAFECMSREFFSISHLDPPGTSPGRWSNHCGLRKIKSR